MISTGNDIVSLSARNYHCTKQPGVYEKILSTTEKILYNDSTREAIPFENFVWLLWSIKESAFKYLQRIETDLIFSPTKFVVQQLEVPHEYTIGHFEGTEMEGKGFDNRSKKFYFPAIEGVIRLGTDTLYSRSFIFKELIVSVVNGNENFENTSWGIKWIEKNDLQYQSKAVRIFLMNRLHQRFQNDNLVVSKSHHGFPIVLEGNEKMPISVSLSHHDHFVAYSFQSGEIQNQLKDSCFHLSFEHQESS